MRQQGAMTFPALEAELRRLSEQDGRSDIIDHLDRFGIDGIVSPLYLGGKTFHIEYKGERQ